MPRIPELEYLQELIYCYYLSSLENAFQLRKIVMGSDDNKETLKKVYNFIDETTPKDDKKWGNIRNELIRIDEKYGLSTLIKK